jgi:hypothetical protein
MPVNFAIFAYLLAIDAGVSFVSISRQFQFARREARRGGPVSSGRVGYLRATRQRGGLRTDSSSPARPCCAQTTADSQFDG